MRQRRKVSGPGWSVAFTTAALCLFLALAGLPLLLPEGPGEDQAEALTANMTMSELIETYAGPGDKSDNNPMAFDEAEILSSLLAEEFDGLAEAAAVGPQFEAAPVGVYPKRAPGHSLASAGPNRALAAAATTAPPAWQRYGKQPPDNIAHLARIAVVIDDLGIDRRRSERSLSLPPAVTLAFLSYGRHSPALAARAFKEGHEILLHLPMEPLGGTINPGPRALLVDHSPTEIAARILWGLSRVPQSVGINNHMGSRFTADPGAMASVMAIIGQRELLFLDSRTTSASTAAAAAGAAEIPFLARDIFLDPEGPATPDIERRLEALVVLAKRRGQAIGIGHPYDATLAALEKWAPALADRDVVLVPLTALLAGWGPQSARLSD